MPADRARITGRAVGFHPRRQLVDDVVVHAVVLCPRIAGGVDVEAGALAQVVGLVIGHVVAARTGVRRHDDDPVLGRIALRAGLGDEVLLVAGQAGEPVQHRQLLALPCLRRQVHAHGHFAAEHVGAVAIHILPTAETGAVFNSFGLAHGFLLLSERAPVSPRPAVSRSAPCARNRVTSSVAMWHRPGRSGRSPSVRIIVTRLRAYDALLQGFEMTSPLLSNG